MDLEIQRSVQHQNPKSPELGLRDSFGHGMDQMATWNKRLGRSFGMGDVFELKMLRRAAAAALTRTAPAAVRNKAMGHANSSIWKKSYENDIVDADIVAAGLEKPSDEAAMRLLGHVSLTRDPNAPYKLTDTQRQQATEDSEVQAAKARHIERGTTLLRSKYKTIAAARKNEKLDLGLRKILHDYDTSLKEFKQIQARKET